MFTVVVFKIAKTWKLKFPLIKDQKKKKMWDTYTYTMEYYPAIKKKKFLPFTTTWMDLKS